MCQNLNLTPCINQSALSIYLQKSTAVYPIYESPSSFLKPNLNESDLIPVHYQQSQKTLNYHQKVKTSWTFKNIPTRVDGASFHANSHTEMGRKAEVTLFDTSAAAWASIKASACIPGHLKGASSKHKTAFLNQWKAWINLTCAFTTPMQQNNAPHDPPPSSKHPPPANPLSHWLTWICNACTLMLMHFLLRQYLWFCNTH